MIYNKHQETLPRIEIEKLQLQRLQTTIAKVKKAVPFYQQQLQKIDDIKHLEDLSSLPFTTKSDLRDHYPFAMFAVSTSEVHRIHASSGTTGKPTVVGYTKQDLETWAEVCARSLVMSGAKPGQIFQNAYGYGLFTGGLGMHYGAEKLGMAVIPISGGNTARQILLLQDFGPQVLACTPSYALTLIDSLQKQQVTNLALKTLILGAEPWTEAMRDEIENKLNVNAINIYGLSEIIGPGVSCECHQAKNGAHIFEDHFIVEVIDPDSGDVLPEGETGELVFTTITKEASPLIRYRTRDIASVTKEPCICGRTHARMSRVIGRNDDMLIIRGVNVFPSQIESALVSMPEIAPHYQLIVDKKQRLDTLEVQVEVQPQIEISEQITETLTAKIAHSLREELGLNAHIKLMSPGSIPRCEGGKAVRVSDLR
ncbi:phenylacetate--CoA ligase family protein [Candidatus Uabimicrobium amorphum]|uniref:Phenylacetate-coenzyme A ligase n=1 Tax=Uabimicrobium amorphum TaxID=2596890 RepID=A0A5S9F6D9_UABAM|nr:phenylacetate--CoA ligase [Candidatus Uabimicrobium amorphum]BBM87787.1 phenylacetate-coenzyme A ligase [Candidatus Uabimicrobium amorphum]